MDRVESLRLFLRVAETGSFSRAARAEKLGQPAVSKAVAALEGAWGTRLFTRTTRRARRPAPLLTRMVYRQMSA